MLNPRLTMNEKIDILGVKVDNVNLSSAYGKIERWVAEKSKVYVCVVPASTVVECRENAGYRDIVNRAAMATPDGMPIVWLGRMKGFKGIRRTYGPDLMLSVCEKGQEKGIRHYFLGGTEEACQKLVSKLQEKFPKIIVAGNFSPPFRELTAEEDERIVGEINRSRPDIIWVGLGSPKQDYWMHQHREKIEAPVMAGVGAAFDFIAGTKPQAPRWMRNTGLEWFFRLCCEPKRLWKRYLIGNSLFLYYLLTDGFRKRQA